MKNVNIKTKDFSGSLCDVSWMQPYKTRNLHFIRLWSQKQLVIFYLVMTRKSAYLDILDHNLPTTLKNILLTIVGNIKLTIDFVWMNVSQKIASEYSVKEYSLKLCSQNVIKGHL